MAIILIGIKNNGFTIDVTTIAPNIVRIIWVASSTAFGKSSSTVLKYKEIYWLLSEYVKVINET